MKECVVDEDMVEDERSVEGNDTSSSFHTRGIKTKIKINLLFVT